MSVETTENVLDELRRQAREVLAPFDRAAWNAQYAKASSTERVTMLREWMRGLNEAGLLGLSWPTQYGGRGLGLQEEEVLAQELARAGSPPLISTVGIYMAGPALITHGADDQKTRYLPAILAGTELWCQGYSEHGAGSDLGALQCRATRQEDGSFRIKGSKIWTSFAHIADRCFLLARTGPSGAPPSASITCFIVDMHAPGVTVTPIADMLGRTEFNEVHFDGVVVSAKDVVGQVDEGWGVAMNLLDHERRMPTRGWAPRLETTLHDLLELAAEQSDLAEDHWDHLGRAIVAERLHAAYRRTMVDDVMCGRYADSDASVAKVAWDDALGEVAAAAQWLLGNSLLDSRGEQSVQWAELVLDAPSHAIAGGTTEMHLNTVAHRALSLPREPRRA